MPFVSSSGRKRDQDRGLGRREGDKEKQNGSKKRQTIKFYVLFFLKYFHLSIRSRSPKQLSALSGFITINSPLKLAFLSLLPTNGSVLCCQWARFQIHSIETVLQVLTSVMCDDLLLDSTDL